MLKLLKSNFTLKQKIKTTLMGSAYGHRYEFVHNDLKVNYYCPHNPNSFFEENYNMLEILGDNLEISFRVYQNIMNPDVFKNLMIGC